MDTQSSLFPQYLDFLINNLYPANLLTNLCLVILVRVGFFFFSCIKSNSLIIFSYIPESYFTIYSFLLFTLESRSSHHWGLNFLFLFKIYFPFQDFYLDDNFVWNKHWIFFPFYLHLLFQHLHITFFLVCFM